MHEFERFWDLVLSNWAHCFKKVRLADMKIRVSSKPAWISWAYVSVTLCLSLKSSM